MRHPLYALTEYRYCVLYNNTLRLTCIILNQLIISCDYYIIKSYRIQDFTNNYTNLPLFEALNLS